MEWITQYNTSGYNRCRKRNLGALLLLSECASFSLLCFFWNKRYSYIGRTSYQPITLMRTLCGRPLSPTGTHSIATGTHIERCTRCTRIWIRWLSHRSFEEWSRFKVKKGGSRSVEVQPSNNMCKVEAVSDLQMFITQFASMLRHLQTAIPSWQSSSLSKRNVFDLATQLIVSCLTQTWRQSGSPERFDRTLVHSSSRRRREAAARLASPGSTSKRLDQIRFCSWWHSCTLQANIIDSQGLFP